jgi:NAD(P)-dependent dehydrogenase (short-subunit alcohol dehydrogenase family)
MSSGPEQDRPRSWFVTGGSRGLGRAFVTAALAAGDSVTATVRGAGALAELAESHPGRLAEVELDVTDQPALRAAVRGAAGRFGGLDVLVNNAGYGLIGGIEELSEEEVRRQFETLVFAPLWAIQEALPTMRRQRRGHVVAVSSLGGAIGLANTGGYNAAKFALEGMHEALALEVAEFGIKVTILEPGPFRTDFNGDSMFRSPPSPAYDSALADRREAMSAVHWGTQPGDPALAAQALLAVVASDHPPLRLLLGGRAADAVPAAYESRLAEAAEWEWLARSADPVDRS